MEPVEFVAVKEEDDIDDLRIENNCLPFDLFEMEEKKQELTDALKYCIDLLKDAQIILDLQNSNGTISRRSQLMGKEIRRRIVDMLYSMKFMDEEMECQEDPMSFSLENSCDSNGKELINDNIKFVEKDASILNQSIECIDEDKSNVLYNYENSVNSGSITTVTSNKIPSQQRALKEKQRRTWDTEVMQQAIDSVRNDKLSVRKASILFHVPKSTLQRLVDKDLSSKECVNMRLGRKPIMSPEMEAQLVDYLLVLENRFFGLTRNDVTKMAYQLAIKNKLKHPFGRTEKAGRAWFDRFIKRHSNLVIHKSSDDTSNFKTFNKETVSAFFKILGNVYEEQNYNADRIFNVDAIGFNIVHCKIPQVVCLKGKRQIGLLTAANRRSLITVICSMSAGGTFIPPMLIFPRKNMTDILMKGAPAGSIGRCHPSGWVQTHLFMEWFEHFIKNTNPTKESPVLLILDGYYAYARNLDVIDIARENFVTILSIPPHSAHKMQPLYCTFIRPFQQYYNEYIHIWQCENERSVKQYNIAKILGKAYLQCQTGLIAANGFKLTGIYPFNPYIFSDSDFITSTSTEKNPTEFISFTREMTTSITKQYHQIEDYHQIEEDLAQPGCSKDSKVEQNAMAPVSLEETHTHTWRFIN